MSNLIILVMIHHYEETDSLMRTQWTEWLSKPHITSGTALKETAWVEIVVLQWWLFQNHSIQQNYFVPVDDPLQSNSDLILLKTI